ncbi:site-2 protease family protein, partial [Singulisphaera rosea]
KLADPPFHAPAGMAVEKDWKPGLRVDDRLVAFGPAGEEPKPVKDGDDWQRRFVAERSRPLSMVFEHHPDPNEGRKTQVETVKVTVPPEHFVDFGFRLAIEPITMIRPGSPAEKAGFHVGDRIVKFDGKDDFDPMRLPDYCDQRSGQTISFEVERTSSGNTTQRQVIEVATDSTPLQFYGDDLTDELMEIPNVGFTYPVRAKIAGVVPGSVAEKAGFRVGDEFTKLTIPATPGEKKAKAREIEFSPEGRGWPGLFLRLQQDPVSEVDISIKGKVKAIAVRPEAVLDWYNPRRGLYFQDLIRRLPPQGIASSLRRGTDDTIANILRIYAMLRSLAQQRVSPKLLGGPLMIAQVAYTQAETGLTEFVHFLGILSINLAVLNFLPMPPLDGGQMVFLIAEKVRGRPLPASAQNVVIWIGVILLICLMVYVLFQDVVRTFFAS